MGYGGNPGSPRDAVQHARVRNYGYSIKVGNLIIKGNCYTSEEAVEAAHKALVRFCELYGIDTISITDKMKKAWRHIHISGGSDGNTG